MNKAFEPYCTQDGDMYLGADGLHYTEIESLLQCGVLGFCFCGMPEENLLFVLEGLELLIRPPEVESLFYGRETTEGRQAFRQWCDDKNRREYDLFFNDQIKYFFYYWCDKEGLTEHGGSVPGWLTEKGSNLVAALRAYRDEHYE